MFGAALAVEEGGAGEGPESDNRFGSFAPMVAGAVDTLSIAVSSVVSAEVAPLCVLMSSDAIPNVLAFRLVSVTVMVSEAFDPTITDAPEAKVLVPSSRLWPL